MKKTETMVCDASVLLQPVLDQDDRKIVRKILFKKNNFDCSILVPDIFRYEFFNVAGRAVDAKTASRSYEELTELQFSIVPLEADLMDGANALMKKYPKISFYDAAYHALARVYRVPFVTADGKYYQMMKKEGDVVLLEDLKL